MWQVRGSEHKIRLLERKQKIQNKFREKMGIIVDKLRDKGKGSSNDGNVECRMYALDTAKELIKEYPWYYLVHKVIFMDLQ